MNRNEYVPAYSRVVQKVLIVFQSQKIFSVVEFEQKLVAKIGCNSHQNKFAFAVGSYCTVKNISSLDRMYAVYREILLT